MIIDGGVKPMGVRRKHGMSNEKVDRKDIVIKEYGDGRYQVWNTARNEVLRPDKLEWLSDYQSHHEWMYYTDITSAKEDAKQVVLKHEVVKEHTLEDEKKKKPVKGWRFGWFNREGDI